MTDQLTHDVRTRDHPMDVDPSERLAHLLETAGRVDPSGTERVTRRRLDASRSGGRGDV